MNWMTVGDFLPPVGEMVFVRAQEFGCEEKFLWATFWQSSDPGQPPKFYVANPIPGFPPHEIGGVKEWSK